MSKNFHFYCNWSTVCIELFANEPCSIPYISDKVKFIEILRIKELLSKSQLTTEDALKLDEELKEV